YEYEQANLSLSRILAFVGIALCRALKKYSGLKGPFLL
ncbi:hypothetical protein II7_04901, partial [Bacillus cereus MSX-A12]